MKKALSLLFLTISITLNAQYGGTPVPGVTVINRVPSTTPAATTTPSNKAAAALVAGTPTGGSTEVGITEGQLEVSLTGAATYNIPIAVPPGVNGLVPQISLAYNSQSGNGMAGYGWNIAGISAITRIPRTKFHDGVVGNVNLDANDRYALDGQRLIFKNRNLWW
jgi:hypothetical protein